MIRQSFGPALGRTRADLSRVAEGISSLRAFSTTQQLATSEDSNGDQDVPAPPRPTIRQRASDAFTDLLNMSGNRPMRMETSRPLGPGSVQPSSTGPSGPESTQPSSSQQPSTGPSIMGNSQPIGLRRNELPLRERLMFRRFQSRPENSPPENPSAPRIISQAPRIISQAPRTLSLGASNAITRDRPAFSLGGSDVTQRPPGTLALGAANALRSPTIIRGEFKPRVGAALSPNTGLPRLRRRLPGGGTMSRGSRSETQKKGGRGKDKDEEDDSKAIDEYSPAVKEMRQQTEMGMAALYDPTITKLDLLGWAPAMASGGSVFARESMVMRQARVLGGNQPYHPLNIPCKREMWAKYNHDNGVFFTSVDMKKWAADVMGLEEFPSVSKETKDAVLQDTLLGTYPVPKHVPLNNTLETVQNYVKKNNSWSAAAERRIQEKIASLLPRQAGRSASKAASKSA